ncbi:MAG TPA: hypothetical protein VGG05_04680 [Pseudonocardiaceae bacterium]
MRGRGCLICHPGSPPAPNGCWGTPCVEHVQQVSEGLLIVMLSGDILGSPKDTTAARTRRRAHRGLGEPCPTPACSSKGGERLTDEDGTSVQEAEQTHAVQFRTGGPPTDLAPYVLRTVPDPAATPVFRAYDLGCTFLTGYVPQCYGGDLSVRVVGDDGSDIAMNCALGQAATTTVTGPDAPSARLAACTGLPQPIRGDDTLLAARCGPEGTTAPPRSRRCGSP